MLMNVMKTLNILNIIKYSIYQTEYDYGRYIPTIFLAARAGSFEIFDYLLQLDGSLVNSVIEDKKGIFYFYFK